MSLSGHLEDLQLRDLLQILYLGRNDGLLQLGCGCDQAELVFKEGLVVSAWRQGKESTRGLPGAPFGAVDEALLVRARRLQKNTVPFRTLDRWLIEECGLVQESLYSALRSAVVTLVHDLLYWDEGNFSFQPGPLAETLLQVACGEHLCLDIGLNVAELSCEEPVVLPVSSGFPVKPPISNMQEAVNEPGAFSCQDEQAAVLLVDDDPQIAVLLVQALAQQGLVARSFGSGGELLSAVRSAWGEGRHPLLIIDLVMPRLHGGGILGGLELVEQVQSLRAEQAFLVYSDYPCPEVELRLRQLGVNELLSKPAQQSPITAERSIAAKEFCNTLALKVAALFENSATAAADLSPAEPSTFPFPVEPAIEQAVAIQCAGMGVLKGLLQELQSVESGDQIMLLVLRFATEILSRAVLFSVDKDRIVGLGQYGYGDAELSANEMVRRIIVPLTEPSTFKEVFDQAAAYCGPLGEARMDTYLREELGLCSSDEIFIGPLLSDDKVVALLCGNNQNSLCGMEDRLALEVFLQQAGAALNNLHLADKLRNLSALLGKTFDC
ncbi:MAG: response regulator [Desulfuromonadaceae bacterium]|nr:response regulator [Desulfuromonadaceae bacterium]